MAIEVYDKGQSPAVIARCNGFVRRRDRDKSAVGSWRLRNVAFHLIIAVICIDCAARSG